MSHNLVIKTRALKAVNYMGTIINNVPLAVKFISIDSGGDMFGYVCRPTFDDCYNHWYVPHGFFIHLGTATSDLPASETLSEV